MSARGKLDCEGKTRLTIFDAEHDERSGCR